MMDDDEREREVMERYIVALNGVHRAVIIGAVILALTNVALLLATLDRL